MTCTTVMPKTIHLTDDDFWDKFKPQKNTIDKNASFNGCMYEHFGKELQKVDLQAKKSPLTVWTILDVDGRLIISQGFQFANRMGFLITKVPAEENTHYEIREAMISDSSIEGIASVDLTELFDYDEPEEITEWQWIQKNASFNHVKNAENGVWEFVLNMSREFENIPASLAGIFTEAKQKKVAYILFHQGT